MAERFADRSPGNNPYSRQGSTNFDNDRYTPTYDDQPFRSSSPPIKSTYPKSDGASDVYHSKVPNNDVQPFKPFSPTIQSSHPTSHGTPEMYHLKKPGNESEPLHDEPPYKPSSPPIHNSYPTTSGGKAELYHLKPPGDTEQDHIPERRPSPGLASINQVSPMPTQHSNGQGAEMYYIRVGNETHQQSPPIHETKFNDQPTYSDDQDHQPPYSNDQDHQPPYSTDQDYPPGKVTMYSIKAADGENIPPPLRTPSPPIRPTKKQQTVSYDIPAKQHPFPTALNDVSSNIRYIPLSQSKASESIQRSMSKYRFGGN